MSRHKNKKENILPAASLPKKNVNCGNCPFFKLIKDEHGNCIRRLADYIEPKNLTVFGPGGNFYITRTDMVCGEHPNFLNS